MAPATRNQRTKLESYAYVMDTILKEPLDGNIRLSVELMGVTGLDDILDLDKESMTNFSKTVTLKTGDTVTFTLSPLEIKKVLRVQAWFAHHDKPTDATWANLNLTGFNTWKTASQADDIRKNLIEPDANITVPGPNADTSTANQTLTQTITPTVNQYNSASNNFQRGIKINIADYTKFKDDKSWYKWTEQIASIASLHQTHNVLNPDYSPTTGEEIELFGSHNRFMYTVFSECIQTPKGKICVRAHSKSMDGQATFKDLNNTRNEKLPYWQKNTHIGPNMGVQYGLTPILDGPIWVLPI